jgi:hypothetical protein
LPRLLKGACVARAVASSGSVACYLLSPRLIGSDRSRPVFGSPLRHS